MFLIEVAAAPLSAIAEVNSIQGNSDNTAPT